MLTDEDIERLFVEWRTPAAGRALIRKIRSGPPVRNLQPRMDCVRTRFVSKKMERALYAESRTCEFPAIYFREYHAETMEMWPQPCTIDLNLTGSNGGSTRVQHTPDLFLVEHGFVIEEWREEARLHALAAKRPEHFYKDSDGRWHFKPIEEHLQSLGIEYRLRSADEHPRVLLSNLQFLADYSIETVPAVPAEERARLTSLMSEHNLLPHLALVHENNFSADHVFQMVLDGTVYVDLHSTLLRKTGELVIYRDRTIAKLDGLMRAQPAAAAPESAFMLSVGSRFVWDGARYEVVLVGRTQVTVRQEDTGSVVPLPLDTVEKMFLEQMVANDNAARLQSSVDPNALFHETRLVEAMRRMEDIAAPDQARVSERTLRRYRARIRGVTSAQEQINALVSRNPGNTTPRLPPEVLAMAHKAVDEFHNKPKAPTVAATYSTFVTLCEEVGLRPMSQANFYRWIQKQSSVLAREGKRMAYQQAPIPELYDFEHPVHGVLPHEVCYCDHTVVNQFLKGSVLPDLGKPTLTVMVDGALSKVRAFYLSYHPASAVSVLMCLRDYVRRNKRLPRILVLDNGKEFHSAALTMFCSLFGIAIRWRRRSRPRDSSMVERMLGATEQEVISQLDGNSLRLKDPRMVSSSHLPSKHIEWTLPGLHGAIEYYLFDVHPKRVHPRFGVAPNEYESRLLLESGTRQHLIIRYDEQFKMLTSSHPVGKPTRVVDRIRGVFVDGVYYWHDKFAAAGKDDMVMVRVEMWNSSVVYICFRNEWVVARARDGLGLSGRFRVEFEMQQREEARKRRTLAQQDRTSAKTAAKRMSLWKPELWDARLREQGTEMYLLYERLGMTEVLPDARNTHGRTVQLGLPQGSQVETVAAVDRSAKTTTEESTRAMTHEPAMADAEYDDQDFF